MINLQYKAMITGDVTLSVAFSLTGNAICSTVSRPLDKYSGSYTVTPTIYSQVLYTKDKDVEDNITVEPIPTNYGLITWNGSFITVS
jgi:hypothetical protein